MGFGVKVWGEDAAVFDVSSLSLTQGSDDSLAKPRHDGLEIEGWKNTFTPTLAGAPLPLEQFETSRSLAIHPDQRRFVLGTEWSLRAFDADGGRALADGCSGCRLGRQHLGRWTLCHRGL